MHPGGRHEDRWGLRAACHDGAVHVRIKPAVSGGVTHHHHHAATATAIGTALLHCGQHRAQHATRTGHRVHTARGASARRRRHCPQAVHCTTNTVAATATVATHGRPNRTLHQPQPGVLGTKNRRQCIRHHPRNVSDATGGGHARGNINEHTGGAVECLTRGDTCGVGGASVCTDGGIQLGGLCHSGPHQPREALQELPLRRRHAVTVTVATITIATATATATSLPQRLHLHLCAAAITATTTATTQHHPKGAVEAAVGPVAPHPPRAPEVRVVERADRGHSHAW